ncbi:MAG TPA: SRPBCC domain-containing protein [Candidatus Krumholzibacteria bacterium]|nr:SRPBCC domain-containing protein [Candidatus Krumholzibacteria bacterium]
MIHDLAKIPDNRRIDTERVVPFTVDEVFGAFADPDLLARWWGPKGFTNTFAVCEFREGGAWTFTMHGPDGRDYANESRFARIRKPSQVVIDHVCPPLFQAHFDFSPTAGGCRIAWSMVFEDETTCAAVRKVAGDANEQNLDRLEAVLGGRPVNDP